MSYYYKKKRSTSAFSRGFRAGMRKANRMKKRSYARRRKSW